MTDIGDGKKRGFFWNTSIYMFSTAFSAIINILVLPIYTRYLSPSDYGIVTLFVMFGNLSAGTLSFSLHFASFRYYFQFKEDLRRFTTLNSTNAAFVLGIFVTAGFCIYYSSHWLSAFLFEGRLSNRLITLSFLSGCLEYILLYMTILLTAQVQPMRYAAITVSRIIIATSFSFYFIFKYSLTYLALIYSLIISQSIMIIFVFIMSRDLFKFRFSFSDLKMSLRLSSPLLPNSMIGVISSSFDRTMLTKVKGTDSVGYYSFGERFTLIIKVIQDAVNKSWEPFFLDRAHENTDESKNAIIRRFYEIAFLLMIIGMGIIYFSEEIIKLLTTKAFYPSMYVTPLYVFYYLFAITGSLTMNQIQFSKKMLYLLPTSAFSVIANIALNILLIPRYGAVGAAGALALSALVSNLSSLYFAMRLYPLPLGNWKLAKMYLIVIIFTAPVYPIMALDTNFFTKFAIKSTLVLLFVYCGVKMHYISESNLRYLFDKVKSKSDKIFGKRSCYL